ncbi:unnamed protein product [Angiostrongylus costaricensis]|uniref:Reverse transcriptase domain-containing protein n=1 Tax=Angiostrongylus costaricensis TaxID=334426 RepID=A0A0R3Q083_ANGCS|nr:unnamed protein product [Angiostrongylus costaricensis]
MDNIHTMARLTEVSREHKKPLYLTSMDLKKAFDSIEIEAVMEALDNQVFPIQCINNLRELYKDFATKSSPFYNDINIDVERGVKKSGTISQLLFTATLENVVRTSG